MESDHQMQELHAYAQKLNGSAIRIPHNQSFTRADVVRAFSESFELIGGVPRLALWAHHNPSEFYKLYGKLLPSATVIELGARVPNNISEISTEELEQLLRDRLTSEQEVYDAQD